MFLQKFFSRFAKPVMASKLAPASKKSSRQDRIDRMTGKIKPVAPKRDNRSFGTAAHDLLNTNTPLTPRPLKGLA